MNHEIITLGEISQVKKETLYNSMRYQEIGKFIKTQVTRT